MKEQSCRAGLRRRSRRCWHLAWASPASHHIAGPKCGTCRCHRMVLGKAEGLAAIVLCHGGCVGQHGLGPVTKALKPFVDGLTPRRFFRKPCPEGLPRHFLFGLCRLMEHACCLNPSLKAFFLSSLVAEVCSPSESSGRTGAKGKTFPISHFLILPRILHKRQRPDQLPGNRADCPVYIFPARP